ncbi:MAG: hypothetical protein R2911_01430 [Caldilineaceae bacterium]
MDLAFNSAGILGHIADDPLATALLSHQLRFRWINHGYTHLFLDSATYAQSFDEITFNHHAALHGALHL